MQGLQDSKRKDDSPLYLGKPYILEVSPILGSKNTCELMGDVLFVRLRKKGEAAKVLEQWYRKEALRVLTERSRHFASLLQVVPTEIVVKTQKTRWGSCDRHNVIRYNWRIVMAPPELLDYLVIHELAHIKEKNHGPNFWALVESILPDYQEKRRALKSFHPSH